MFKPLVLALLVTATAAVANAQTVTIEQAWTRPTTTGQRVGGGFATLRNTGALADRLLGASTAAAERVEMHSMSMDNNVMRMRQVDAIDLPAGEKVDLAPGGLHLMLMGLKAPLQAGDSVPVLLRFERAGEVSVVFKIGARPGAGGHDGHGMPRTKP